MSEQRWAVLGTETGHEWLVIHPGDVSRRSDGRLECWGIHSSHDTWAEAMQEADRMARTVTVTLSRVQDKHEIKVSDDVVVPIIVWKNHKGDYVVQESVGMFGSVELSPDEIEPVALALLAHARKEQHRG